MTVPTPLAGADPSRGTPPERVLLTHEEALRLLRAAQAGDEDAQETLVRCNVALVKSVVKKFLGRGVEYDDLFQIGCMGLVKAINNFSDEFNVRFSTYAVPMIAGEIKRFLRDDGMVKVSRSLKELAAKSAAVAEQLKRECNRDPSIQEIASVLGVDAEEVVFAQDAARAHLSLQEPVFEDSGATLLDQVAQSEDEGDAMIDRILLKELIGKLDARDRKIVFLRYFQDKTQSEIARLMGVSQVQISRLESKIIQRLKSALAEPDEGD